MYNPELKQSVEALFTDALQQTQDISALHRELSRCYQRLQQPMRVAIVGRIKAGKSTFMNALLEEHIVETGAVETTFNVNWLHYGPQRVLTIYYKDEHVRPEQTSFQRLAELTKRSEDPTTIEYLRSIKYIQVAYPNGILQSFDLIDTPGLESIYEDDAQNTLDFLQKHGHELTETTQQEAQHADAVLYLFSKGLSESDDSVLQEFQGKVAGQARPFNAIGVLTKADINWKVYDDPVKGIQTVTTRLASSPHIQKLFYRVMPVAAMLGLGAKTMTADEYQTLMQVVALPEKQFQRMIQSEDRFTKVHPDISIAVTQRVQLVQRLGLYGISLAHTLLKQQGNMGRKNLADALYAHSGLAELRELILSHFGERAYLIKLSVVLRQVETAFIEARQYARGPERSKITELAGRFQLLHIQEQATEEEVAVLSDCYNGNLQFPRHEVEELRRMTGEYGPTYYDRLDMPPDATREQLTWAARTRLHHWKEKEYDYLFNRATRNAASVIAQAYNRVVYELIQ